MHKQKALNRVFILKTHKNRIKTSLAAHKHAWAEGRPRSSLAGKSGQKKKILTIYSKEWPIPGFFYQHLPLKINMIPHLAQCVMVMDAIFLGAPCHKPIGRPVCF